MKSEIVFLETCIHVKVLDEVSLQEYEDLLERLVSHDRWKRGTSILLDETKAILILTNTNSANNYMDLICKYHKSIGNSKIAVAASTDDIYGVNQTIEELFRQSKMMVPDLKIFRTVNEAIGWLNCRKIDRSIAPNP